MSKSKRHYILIIFISWLAYLISYLGRSDYSASILEIVTATGITRAAAGMISSAFALCNAFGQLASTLIINKISPIKLIAIELLSVATVNLLFPVSDNFYLMMLLWGINGCMQATLLCGITHIFSETLDEPWLSRGAVSLNTIGAVGGMINYFLSPLLIRFFNWKIVFFTISTMLFLLGILWCIVMPKLTTHKTAVIQKSKRNDTDIDVSSSILQILKRKDAICAIMAALP